ncbi:MAG: hypothetical protein L0Z50_05105 [Verrucomicrobiales bacterium]|nr:hypothetical protein [Verrucomicrobiales bacterium]
MNGSKPWWQAHALDKRNARFPLTPALSLGERENRRPRVEQSTPLGLARNGMRGSLSLGRGPG